MIALNEKAPVRLERFADRFCSRSILFFDRVSSTNIVTKNLAKKGLHAAVVSSSQFAGKGRLGRKWESDSAGGLCISFTLHREPKDVSVPLVSIATTIAVLNALHQYADLDFRIKWPNDIILNGKKICGIIAEAVWGLESVDYMVIGAGINVNQMSKDFSEPLRKSATSLFLETGKIYSTIALAYETLKSFDEVFNTLQKIGEEPIIEQYRQNCHTLGRTICIKDGCEELFKGTALDVDKDGSLIVRGLAGQVEKFNYGELSSREI